MWLSKERKAPIKVEEEAALFAEYKRTGDPKIRERFIMSVYAIVCREARLYPSTYVPTEDLIQAGMAGVIEAFKRFDPVKGERFNTYASYWIKREILGLVRRERTIVSGSGLCAGRPDQDGRRRVWVTYIDDDGGQGRDTSYASGDARSEDSTAVLDRLVSTPAAVGGNTDGNDRVDTLRRLLAETSLEPREREVVKRRWLTRSGEPLTLEEVAAGMGFTREWIRRIELSAFAKLRKYADRKGLK
jgi:RNA polymerase sigma factor (sigma-70 family)